MGRLPFLACVLLFCLSMVSSPLSAGKPQGEATAPFRVEARTGIEFGLIPGGDFTMGSDGGREDEKPPHPARVDDFALGRFEVSQRQWKKVMKDNPSHFKGCDDCPVEQVSWNDAQDFFRRAGDLAGIEFRLPTEAEWEYAAGGGALHQKWPGTNVDREAGEYSWYSGNFAGKTHPVGRKIPNAFMIYDMGGNVAEWCADWYGEDSYRAATAKDRKGPAAGTRRVVRGGSWLSGPQDTRTSRRAARSPETRTRTIGFRAAIDAAYFDRLPTK